MTTGGEVARRMGRSRFAARIGGSAAIASRWPRTLRRSLLAALPRELAAPPPLPRVGLARATIFRQLGRLVGSVRYDFCLRLSHAIFIAHAARVMEKSYTISTIYSCLWLRLSEGCKGRFTRQYNFVAWDKLTTSLRHESFLLNQTYNLLTIVAYDTKNVVGFWNMF